MIDTDITTKNAGVWQTIDDKLVWIVEIEATKAKSISLNFKNLSLPAAGELYLITKKKDYIHGPITAKNIQKEVSLMPSEVMPGSRVWVYYIQPKYEQNTPNIQIASIGYGYRGYDFYASSKIDEVSVEERAAAACNVDANNSKGDCFRMEQNAVVLMLINLNTTQCSGTLMNNTARNYRGFVLTANHCTYNNAASIDFAQVTFRFKYFSTGNYISVTGTDLRARTFFNAEFALLETTKPIPSDIGVFYLGWSRSTTPTSSVVLHHPQGSFMRITRDNDNKFAEPNAMPFQGIGLTANSSWRTSYAQANDFGFIEPGSSGSALLNDNHEVTGQCSGGDNLTCNGNSVGSGNKWFGRFDVSWTGDGTSTTRLKDWLDPTNNTNIQSQLAAFDIDASTAIPCSFAQSAWVQPLKTAAGVSYTYQWNSSQNISLTGTSNSITFNPTTQPVGTNGWIQCNIRTPMSCGNQLIATSVKNITWVNPSSGLIKATDNSTNQRLPTISNMTANSCKNFTIGFEDIIVPQNVSFNWTFSGNTNQFWTTANNNGKSLSICCYGSGTLYATVQVINGTACLAGLARTYTISYGNSGCSWCLVSPSIDNIPTKEALTSSMKFTEEIKIFPNPTLTNQVIIQLPKYFNFNSSKIKVFDMYGKFIQSFSIENAYQIIPIENIKNGMYLIEANDGIHQQANRLIIQR